MTSHKPAFFEKLLRFSFLLAGLTGFLRLYGAIAQQPDILIFSDKAWLPAYLMIAGGLIGFFNITISLLIKWKSPMPFWLPWAGVLMNIIAYWAERLFLWAPSQRITNTLWVLGMHVAWLMLVVISQQQMKRRHNEYE